MKKTEETENRPRHLDCVTPAAPALKRKHPNMPHAHTKRTHTQLHMHMYNGKYGCARTHYTDSIISTITRVNVHTQSQWCDNPTRTRTNERTCTHISEKLSHTRARARVHSPAVVRDSRTTWRPPHQHSNPKLSPRQPTAETNAPKCRTQTAGRQSLYSRACGSPGR